MRKGPLKINVLTTTMSIINVGAFTQHDVKALTYMIR